MRLTLNSVTFAFLVVLLSSLPIKLTFSQQAVEIRYKSNKLPNVLIETSQNYNEDITISQSDSNGVVTLLRKHNCLRIDDMRFNRLDTCFQSVIDGLVVIELTARAYELPEISSDANNSVEDGSLTISPLDFKKSTLFLGDLDVSKMIQFQAGVLGGEELSNDLFVRGGTSDQNLFLLNGVPIFRPNHVMGFQSAIDGSSVESIKFYKSEFPVDYNGRLSSVISVETKSGNVNKLGGEVNIGLINTGFQLSGSVLNKNTTFFSSFRTAPIGLVGLTVNDANERLRSEYFLTDGILTIKSLLNQRHTLKAFIYSSYDFVGSVNTIEHVFNGSLQSQVLKKSNIQWSNKVGGLKIISKLSENLNAENSLSWSNYDYRSNQLDSTRNSMDEPKFSYTDLSINNRITRLSIKSKLVADWNSYIKMVFGSEYAFFSTIPFGAELESRTPTRELVISNLYHRNFDEWTNFFELKKDWVNNWSTSFGLNHNWVISDNVHYHSMAPSAAVTYSRKFFMMRFAYDKTYQNLHNFILSDLEFKNEALLSPDTQLSPQLADQLSVVIEKKWFDKAILRVDGYFKSFKQQSTSVFDIDKIDNFINLQHPNNLVITGGSGKSFGLEFYGQRIWSNIEISANYTFSRSFRTYDGLNSGLRFPATYDRPHSILINGVVNISKEIMLTTNWVFYSGRRVTLPVQDLVLPNGQLTWLFGNKNNGRLANYHRLDVGAQFEKHKRRGVRTWSFGVYNACNAQNANFLRRTNEQVFDNNGEFVMNRRGIKGISLLPVFPYLNYKYAF